MFSRAEDFWTILLLRMLKSSSSSSSSRWETKPEKSREREEGCERERRKKLRKMIPTCMQRAHIFSVEAWQLIPQSQAHTHSRTHTRTLVVVAWSHFMQFILQSTLSQKEVFFKNIEIAEKFFFVAQNEGHKSKFCWFKLKAFSCESIIPSVSWI